MAKNTENRLKKIMDKLYHAPRPRLFALSRPGGGDVIAGKETVSRALALRRPEGKVPPCRPWDRGDLIMRLATFKAMTWFGKPKDISPVNCAMRGWINVEMDVIVCEACGARLLFSTSPSWTLQQVEKSAAVFSLKLDNGHKLLCPWINNVCDESLASFPPSPPQVLVEGLKERSHALLRLTTLPVISSLAIDYMKSPQLDHFLSMPFQPSITLNNKISLIDDCISKEVDDATESNISHGYYQAQKIISLCGWEPRLLPYTIDFEDKCGPSSKTTNPPESSEETCGEPTQNITNCSPSSHNDREYLYDQSSTVLDCRFCGTCVGLWFFKTTPRPLEFFKIIIDDGRQNELGTGAADLGHAVEVARVENFGRRDHTSNIESPLGLHLTIAGGPPPTKQHFRPKVSLPVVSRHIRAELSYNSCLSYHQGSSRKEDHVCQQKEVNGHQDAQSQDVGCLKRKRADIDFSNSELPMEGNHGDAGNGVTSEGGREHTSEETLSKAQCTDIILRDDVACPSGSVTKPTDARESNDLVSRLDELNYDDKPENDLCVPSVYASSSVNNLNSPTYSKTAYSGSCFQNVEGTSVGEQDPVKTVSLSNTRDVDQLSGNLKSTLAIEFDPIKQHRPFCPWISDQGYNLPGWKATLSALYNLQKNSSQQPGQTEGTSSFLDEDDDPIISVRRLFRSPQSKRFKGMSR